ncbi:hypothetical protein HYW74_03455 [Candidatus Pacearchaeota archaeon]|nr:hypothetical protein [Candidatus Pacearchaeota archaeon]
METATQTQYKLVDQVIPRVITLASICYEAPFDAGKELIEIEGFYIPSADENARLRIQEGENAFCSNNGNWVKEGPLYLRRDNTRLLRTGLPYLHPREATEAHKTGEYTSLEKEDIEKGREEGLKVKNSDLDKGGLIKMPTDSLGSDKYGLWFFGGEKGTDAEKSKRAQNYGDFLLNSRFEIKDISIKLDKQEYTDKIGDHASQLWFNRLDNRSELNGSNWFLHFDSGVRGVR